MARYRHVAAPLATTFVAARLLQGIAFICVVGLTANFVSEIVRTGYSVAPEISGTLSVTCLAALYCIISVAFFWSNVGLLVMAACDGLLLIAFIVISVVLGRPLSYVDCSAIASADANTNASSAYAWVMSVGHNLKGGDFLVFTGATKANCYESKGAWGLCIALSILFFTTVMLLFALHMTERRALRMAQGKA